MKNSLNNGICNKAHLDNKNSSEVNFEAYTGSKNGTNGLQLMGIVQAGFPTHAEENEASTLSLDDYIIENKEATYLLKVKGESMLDAGIFEGDLAVVERGRNPKNGDIVIALIDGSWTMKYFRQTNGTIFLEPANKNYPLFYPQEELKVEAVVVAIVRKYQ